MCTPLQYHRKWWGPFPGTVHDELYQSRSRTIRGKRKKNHWRPSSTWPADLYSMCCNSHAAIRPRGRKMQRASGGHAERLWAPLSRKTTFCTLTAMTLQSHSMLDSRFPWHSQWEQMQRTSRIRWRHVARSVGRPPPVLDSFLCTEICPQIRFTLQHLSGSGK